MAKFRNFGLKGIVVGIFKTALDLTSLNNTSVFGIGKNDQDMAKNFLVAYWPNMAIFGKYLAKTMGHGFETKITITFQNFHNKIAGN